MGIFDGINNWIAGLGDDNASWYDADGKLTEDAASALKEAARSGDYDAILNNISAGVEQRQQVKDLRKLGAISRKEYNEMMDFIAEREERFERYERESEESKREAEAGLE